MAQYIQKPNGQMAGSVGDGRDDVPTSAQTPSTSDVVVDTAGGSSLADVAASLKRQHEQDIADIEEYCESLYTFAYLYESVFDSDDVEAKGFEKGQVYTVRQLVRDQPDAVPFIAEFARKEMQTLNAPLIEHMEADWRFDQMKEFIEFSHNDDEAITVATILATHYGFTPQQRDSAAMLLRDGYESSLEDFVHTVKALS